MNTHIGRWAEENGDRLEALACDLWQHPELALQEFHTAQSVAEFMEAQGFAVERIAVESADGTPNGVVARWGEGRPSFGFYADMDAFPDTGNEPVPRKARVEGAGHACGHHLCTTASVGAACALKRAMEAEGRSGSVVFFGCPAEEAVGGKQFMARDGLFDGVDFGYQWHPSGRQLIFGEVAIRSVCRMDFTFIGDPARKFEPFVGRNGLDAAELMALGIAAMRNDFPRGMFTATVHSLPKPELSRDLYKVSVELRYPDFGVVCEAKRRAVAIAKGAALMTACRVEWKLRGLTRHFLPNLAMNDAAYQAALKVPPLVYDERDRAYALEVFRAYNGCDPDAERLLAQGATIPEWLRLREDGSVDLLPCEPQKNRGGQWAPAGGTDLSHVTFITPIVYVSGGGCAVGVPAHMWCNAVITGSSIGMKAMRYATGLLAQAAYDTLVDEDLQRRIRDEFDESVRRYGGFYPLDGNEHGSFDAMKGVPNA